MKIIEKDKDFKKKSKIQLTIDGLTNNDQNILVRKLGSKKGYIFSYEALIVIMLFLIIFFIITSNLSSSMLTAQNEIHSTQEIQKVNLLATKIYKDYEFPSDNYESDYYDFLTNLTRHYYSSNKIKGSYDPNCVDIYNYEYEYQFNNIEVSDINSLIVNTSTHEGTFERKVYNFNRKKLVPVSLSKQIGYKYYFTLSQGQIFYYKNNDEYVLGNITLSSDVPTNAIFEVNGVITNRTLSSTESLSEFEKFLDYDGGNCLEIKLLSVSNSPETNKVYFTITNDYNIMNYGLKLESHNITLSIGA
ncbi:hypothetical protein [Methanococcus voltae]|uniref:Uncharacterized protein n=1 Tax=Methanococcus voltae (strain ATCC BAA-1334 / A3) TaxID=456320 RepID=D7DUR1_METV3|nr:hypothetical protein [Methanococcus voltae]MCS3900673.1 hypothetical protein [Methanococcus voltae]